MQNMVSPMAEMMFVCRGSGQSILMDELTAQYPFYFLTNVYASRGGIGVSTFSAWDETVFS